MSIIVLPAKKIVELEEKLPELDLDQAMSYSLADAIREGASVVEQARGSYVKGDKVCALSAAVLAARARHLL
jgi:hypothetical protein